MLIQVNDVTFKVSTTGSGSPLLLLHGFSGSHHSWDAFVPSWCQSYQVIAVDIIGHGLSDAPTNPTRYSMEHAVNDLAALLDFLNIKKTAVLGYSMGGRLALSFAVLKPSRVSTLLLESVSPGLSVNEDKTARIVHDETLAETIEQKGIEWFVNYWESIPLFASVNRLAQAEQLALRKQRLSNRTLGLANSLRGMGTGAQPSWWEELRSLHMPVLLMTGALDHKFNDIARNMALSIPHCTVVQFKEAGHLIHVEQPQKFDTIVMDYLKSR